MAWAHMERGEGRPLVLVHGIGSSQRSWLPIIDRLARRRRVLAFDLPGFGDSPRLQEGLPTAMHFAELLPQQLEELGISEFDICGFSLGGWVALEVAKLGVARSAVALTPAGLWPGHQPAYSHFVLDYAHNLAVGRSERLIRALGHPVGRTALMLNYFARPWRLTADFALESSETLAACTDWDRTLEGLRVNRFLGGSDIEIPLTVAFGTRDWIHLPLQTRHRGELPDSTVWVRLPGCGHVPMTDDPELVSSVILAGTE